MTKTVKFYKQKNIIHNIVVCTNKQFENERFQITLTVVFSILIDFYCNLLRLSFLPQQGTECIKRQK